MHLERLKMEYNKQLIEKIFFEEIIPETRKGTIEIPVFDKYSNAEEMSTFNISLTVNEPESEFNLNIQKLSQYYPSIRNLLFFLHISD